MSYQVISRSLNGDEITMCERVFAGTLPTPLLRTKVMLANGLGASDRPFASYDVGIATYRIYIGPRAFDAASRVTLEYKATFVHEMTHVWQMYRSRFGFLGVWTSSLVSQACRQGNAYLYGEGNLNKPWDSFGTEEQAQIVEDWFKNGLKSTDPRFHYIRNDLRDGKPGYVGHPPYVA
ncbi:hypothetical protein [Reyranella sp. CPCC 100927]|uniref:hypothetical protein n=1 Tax=Reyranella sp. CPCC 100927 TaxID=2599616 RepID=UPI0011B67FAC|nr:hypothetical protein [Reyranella sp. CPCC 100927]TWS96603.1 hypothetical protein FQU96_38920 [Reyranella sp. CPCC 100927]